MATKMFFSSQNCKGVTSGTTGRSYDADKSGFIHVEDSRDVKSFADNGYVQAGGMPRLRKFYVCDSCEWEASISHCPRCGRDDLRRVEK